MIAAKAKILELLRSGEWELGYGFGTRSDGRFWLQKGGLCKGGESITANRRSVDLLEADGLIARKQRQEGQPYWLTRYELTEPTHADRRR